MASNWPTKKSESEYMKMRQNQNMVNAEKNKAENWFFEKLKKSRYKFSRQRRWGYRIFDFWCHQLGLAVEIDGPEHKKGIDEQKDLIEFNRSRIITLRVKNFNEEEAYKALEYIHSSESWNDRRTAAGMKPIKM